MNIAGILHHCTVCQFIAVYNNIIQKIHMIITIIIRDLAI